MLSRTKYRTLQPINSRFVLDCQSRDFVNIKHGRGKNLRLSMLRRYDIRLRKLRFQFMREGHRLVFGG